MPAQSTYTSSIARNIPQEMAELARERGGSITRRELMQAGYTDEQIEKHWPAAAALLATSQTRRPA